MRLGEGPSRQIEHPSDANKTVRIHKKVIPLLEIRPRFQAYVVALPSFATLPADIDKARDTFSCKISIAGSPGHFAAINTKPRIFFDARSRKYVFTFVFGQKVIFMSFSCHHRSQMVPIPFLRIRASVQTSRKRTSPAEEVPACTTKLCFRMCREPRGFKSTELFFSSTQLSLEGHWSLKI